MQLVDLKVQTPAPGQAQVTATLKISGERIVRRFSLLAVKGTWRIDDITDAKGQNSLRETLKHSIALHAPGHKR